MIVEERMRTYINSLDMGNTPFLEELEKEALAGRVPIIRKEMQSFLKMFLAATRPMKILEVGTAVGFSTLLMCEYGPENLKITTIENYEKRIPIARANFRKAGRESQIEFLTGDAGEILKELTGTYDLIFMDAAKGQYMNWLPVGRRGFLRLGRKALPPNLPVLRNRHSGRPHARRRRFHRAGTARRAGFLARIPLGSARTHRRNPALPHLHRASPDAARRRR